MNLAKGQLSVTFFGGTCTVVNDETVMMCFSRLSVKFCYSTNDLLTSAVNFWNDRGIKFRSESQFNHEDIQIASINGMNESSRFKLKIVTKL